MRLIKPLIYPQIMRDESILMYLSRIAELNGYTKIQWLFEDNKSSISMLSKLAAVRKVSWTGVDKQNDFGYRFNRLNNRDLLPERRFCPKCLADNGYWKACWQSTGSFVCQTHKIWLVDTCLFCNNKTPVNAVNHLACSCEKLFSETTSEPASEDALNLQAFVNQGELLGQKGGHVLPVNHSLSLQKRIEFVNFIAYFTRNPKSALRGKRNMMKKMSEVKSIAANLAFILLNGKSSFLSFTGQLQRTTVNGASNITEWTPFYSKLCTQFPQPCFAELKRSVEWYRKVKGYYATRRNRNFDPESLEKNCWLPIRLAAKKYGLKDSAIKTAVIENVIDSQVTLRGTREFILVDLISLESRLDYINEFVSLKGAQMILGLTKKQMRTLLESDFFTSAIPPKLGVSSSWRIAQNELIELFPREEPYTRIRYRNPISLGEAIQKYSRIMPNMLCPLLKTMKFDSKFFNNHCWTGNFTSFRFDEDKLKQWITLNQQQTDLSIADVAKNLKVHQEFVYQLVKGKWLNTYAGRNLSERRISFEQLTTFKYTFVVASKMAKALGIPRAIFLNQLAANKVFPLDHKSSKKLRQKIYLRHEIRKIKSLKHPALSQIDWD